MSVSHRRTSSRKAASPLSVVIPPLHMVAPAGAAPVDNAEPSPRRHRGRHIPLRDPGHAGLFTVSEEGGYNSPGCVGWCSTPSYSQLADPFDDLSWHCQELDSKTVSAPPRRRPQLEIDTRLRTMRSQSRPPRVPSVSTAPYPRGTPIMRPRALLPALPILPSLQVDPPSLPVTPTTPSDAVNIVSQLKELFASCGEFDDVYDKPEPGQFEDALSPVETVRVSRPPITPMGTALPPTLPPILPRRRDSQPFPGLDGNHEFLQSLALEDISDLSSAPSISSLPSLCSRDSLSSASSQSISSLSSVTQGFDSSSASTTPSPPRKPRVSSRRPVRGPLPSLWTA